MADATSALLLGHWLLLELWLLLVHLLLLGQECSSVAVEGLIISLDFVGQPNVYTSEAAAL